MSGESLVPDHINEDEFKRKSDKIFRLQKENIKKEYENDNLTTGKDNEFSNYVRDIKREPDDMEVDVPEPIIIDASLRNIKEEPFDVTSNTTQDVCNGRTFVNNVCSVEGELNEMAYDLDSTLHTENYMEGNNFLTQEMLIPRSNMNHSGSKYLYCELCNENYKWFCPKCSMLLYILNNSVRTTVDDWTKRTIPHNLLEIKTSSDGLGIFALETTPAGIIFGSFDGLDSVQSTMGSAWKLKLKCRKLVSVANGKYANWMQYINCANNMSQRNLIIFQYEHSLYYRSIRMIEKGEELLVHYGEQFDKILEGSGNDNGCEDVEILYHPLIEKKMEKVYACTFCCLGFSSEEYLMKHKTICTYIINTDAPIEEEIVQCVFCKIFLGKKEYSGYHMNHCCDKYRRKSSDKNQSDRVASLTSTHTELDQDFTADSTENEASEQKEFANDRDREKIYKCSKCSYISKYKHNLKQHLYTHEVVKPFECKICHKRFLQNVHLRLHTRDQHEVAEKEFKCPKCPYQTNYSQHLRQHVNRHDGIKPFRCEVCERYFSEKKRLEQHKKNIHNTGDRKEYKCSKCPYETNYRYLLKQHFRLHNVVTTSVECKTCSEKFQRKEDLIRHINQKHDACEPGMNKYKCAKCSFEANHSEEFRRHLYMHDDVKLFECKLCDRQFTRNAYLKEHVKNFHVSVNSDGICVGEGREYLNEKKFKCPKCTYKTNQKGHLKLHIINIHDRADDKQFKCEKCNFQTNYKRTLSLHLASHVHTHKNEIKTENNFENTCAKSLQFQFHCKICSSRIFHVHDDVEERIYKCSECTFETKHRVSLKRHVERHHSAKLFLCQICNQRFQEKETLEQHQKDTHVQIQADCEEYQCSKCAFKTKFKKNLRHHLKIHDRDSLKPYPCVVCGKGFVQQRHLERHVDTHHPIADVKADVVHVEPTVVVKCEPNEVWLPECNAVTE